MQTSMAQYNKALAEFNEAITHEGENDTAHAHDPYRAPVQEYKVNGITDGWPGTAWRAYCLLCYEYEALGMTTSDAQGVTDAALLGAA